MPAVDEASVLRARSRPLAAKLLVAAGMALAVAGCVAVLAILVALLAAGIADNEGAAARVCRFCGHRFEAAPR